MSVQDKPCDRIVLVRNDRLVQKIRQRDIGQGHLRSHTLPRIGGSGAGQLVARAQRAGPRQERAQVRKGEATGADGVALRHGGMCIQLGKTFWTPFIRLTSRAVRYSLNS